MEGIPGWFFLAIFVIYGWMILSAVPVLIAGGLFIADRRQAALILFAAGLLSEAIAWALFCLVVGVADGLGLTLSLLSVSLLTGGAAQFIAALRNQRMYVPTLALALAAVLVVAAVTPMFGGIVEALDLPPMLRQILVWHSLPIVLCSLALACASLFCAFRRVSQASKEATLAKWSSGLQHGVVDLVVAGRVFGGRPGESSQQPVNYSYDGHVLVIRFATTEVLTVEEPSDFVLSKAGDLIIPHSRKATFGWHSYGRPQTPENWCEQTDEGARIELVRWGTPQS